VFRIPNERIHPRGKGNPLEREVLWPRWRQRLMWL
jgi:hypothetical protein